MPPSEEAGYEPQSTGVRLQAVDAPSMLGDPARYLRLEAEQKRLNAEIKALKTCEEQAQVAACTRATGYVAVTKARPSPLADGGAARPHFRLAA